MEAVPDIVKFARNLAVLVRIRGPDPKCLKIRRHAFHHQESGRTTLSASGFLVPDSLNLSPFISHLLSHNSETNLSALVLTTASVVEPFLPVHRRNDPAQVFPELIPGAQIDVLAENKEKIRNNLTDQDERSPHWLPAHLLGLVDVPASALCVQSLMEANSSSPEHGIWDVGWSLAPLSNSQSSSDALQIKVRNDMRSSSLGGQLSSALDEPSSPTQVALSTTRIAFLRVPMICSKDLPPIDVSPLNNRGDFLVAMGSPFGILSPLHFINSISVGVVSNCCPPGSPSSSLLMADLRCLPGMEGGPVFGENNRLIGILTRPLRQRVGGAEIQLVITWSAIATAGNDLLPKEPKRVMMNHGLHDENREGLRQNNGSQSIKYACESPASHWSQRYPFEKALPSVVLVTVGDGAWASGVVLNNHGLILTNAHLLEPWRFGRTNMLSQLDKTTVPALSILFEKPVWQQEESNDRKVKLSDASVGEEHMSAQDLTSKSYKRVRVRLDHMESCFWCDARVVYISKGPVDIALLQLESVPNHLCAIVPHFACPPPGSKVHVIGHGLFGPRSGLLPSISSGVVARVVEIRSPLHLYESGAVETEERYLPIMIETTAAVHPGVSGGAVVNSDGHMVGLVTSNAKHGGGTIIPHLNFSIPCATLKPVFEFSRGDMQDLSVLHAMDKPNEVLSSVWALKPPPSSPRPFFPHTILQKNNEGKGMRFAKFLAEKHAEISNESAPSENRPIKAVNFSTLIRPSKL